MHRQSFRSFVFFFLLVLLVFLDNFFLLLFRFFVFLIVEMLPCSDSRDFDHKEEKQLQFHKLFNERPPAWLILKSHCKPLASTVRLFIQSSDLFKDEDQLKNLPLRLEPKELMCPICTRLMQNPLTTQCGHSFCQLCIESEMKTERGTKCPICRTEIRPLLKVFALQNVIDEQDRLCPNKPCPFAGPFSQLKRHLNSNESDPCTFLEGRCEACDAKMNWQEFTAHEPDCRATLVQCIHDDEILPIHRLRNQFEQYCSLKIACVQCNEKVPIRYSTDHLAHCFTLETSYEIAPMGPGLPADVYLSSLDEVAPGYIITESIHLRSKRPGAGQRERCSFFAVQCYLGGKICLIQHISEENIFLPGFVLHWNQEWVKKLCFERSD